MCGCKPMMIVPVKLDQAQAYWAYKHSNDGRWHVKRWFQSNGAICDLCHAHQEIKEGNDFIQKITPYPIYALDRFHAIGILEAIEKNHLNEATWKSKYSDLRFEGILDE